MPSGQEIQPRIAGLERLAAVSLVLFAAAAFTTNVADHDLWGHLRYGHDFLRHGVLTTDPYSYTAAGQPWLEHEWGAEVLFALVYDACGATGLVLAKAILGAGALAVVLGLGWASSQSLGAVAVVFVPAVIGLFPWFGCRPQVFTHAFMALTLLAIDGCRRGRRRFAVGFFLLMLVWVNVHAGFLAGLGLFGVATAVDVATAWHRGEPVPRLLPAALAAALLATTVSPYGPGYVLHVLPSALMARPDIPEWRPFDAAALYDPTLWVVPPLIGGAALALWHTRARRDAVEVVLLGVTAALALAHIRHVPFFLLACVWVLPRHLVTVVSAVRTSGRTVVVTALVAGTLAGVRGALAVEALPRLVVRARDFPVGAVRFMEREGIAGNVAVDFNWGSYLIGKCFPACRVSIDGRYEAAYPADVYAMNRAFTAGAAGWDRLLRDYPSEIALLPAQAGGTARLTGMTGWTLVYRDPTAALFLRDLPRFADVVARFGSLPATEVVGDQAFP